MSIDKSAWMPPQGYHRELLLHLAEEASEVVQECMKALRFGLDERQPGNPISNAQRIAREVGNFNMIVSELRREGLISSDDLNIGAASKAGRLPLYTLHYNERLPESST